MYKRSRMYAARNTKTPIVTPGYWITNDIKYENLSCNMSKIRHRNVSKIRHDTIIITGNVSI